MMQISARAAGTGHADAITRIAITAQEFRFISAIKVFPVALIVASGFFYEQSELTKWLRLERAPAVNQMSVAEELKGH